VGPLEHSGRQDVSSVPREGGCEQDRIRDAAGKTEESAASFGFDRATCRLEWRRLTDAIVGANRRGIIGFIFFFGAVGECWPDPALAVAVAGQCWPVLAGVRRSGRK